MLNIKADYPDYANALNGLTFIDLFAGIGAFRYALESFGAKCVFSSEWDKDSQDVYEANHGHRPAGDITKINAKDIPCHDILCGGFPCQPFSIAGKKKGLEDETRGNLFNEIMRIVDLHRPKVIFLENVKNLQGHDNGKTIKIICDEIETKRGYSLFCKVLNASQFGVPQARERIFLIAFRRDLEIEPGAGKAMGGFSFPSPPDIKIYLEDILEKNVAKSYFNSKLEPTWDKVNEYPVLDARRIGYVNSGRQGERIYSIKGHAITLSSSGGGPGGSTGLYRVNGKIRKLTPFECARLCGFPDDFKLAKSKTTAYKQFGNSIVINVLQHCCMAIINTLREKHVIA